jgi:hypothetical protein
LAVASVDPKEVTVELSCRKSGNVELSVIGKTSADVSVIYGGVDRRAVASGDRLEFHAPLTRRDAGDVSSWTIRVMFGSGREQVGTNYQSEAPRQAYDGYSVFRQLPQPSTPEL